MAEFIYTAMNASGTEVKGTIDANNESSAREKLIAQNLSVTSIRKEAEMTWEEYFSKNNRSINQRDIMMFTKYFAVLTKAGIPIIKSLVILEKQVDNLRLKKKVKKIRVGVEAGSNLFEQFSHHPETFPPMYLSLLKIGEESGMLYDMLDKLNMFLKKSAALKGKVKSAMIYPVVIMCVAGLVVIFLMAFVIPRFSAMFKSFKSTLPLPTQIVIAISNFVQNYIIYEVLGAVAIGWAIKAFYAWPVGRQIWDKVSLKIPLVGALTVKYSINAFCSNLAVLLKSGVSISKALEITNDSIDNLILKSEFSQMRVNVEAGMSIGDAVAKSPSMPDMVGQMISIGDQTGTLENMLENISSFYEEEVDQLVDALTSLIEPLFIVFLGGVVGSIVIAMFLPILQMSKAVQH
ncbi:MAG: type II secretion system F family protein [Candidatus Wallbacteria bacterium]